VKIPYHKPYHSSKEKEYIFDAINKSYITGDGFYTKQVSEFLEQKFRINRAYMTTSATHALEMASLIIDIELGDEVIMPSFTFTSTANSIVLRGAKPVFCDIDENTLNISPKEIESKLTHKTKVIIPVHYGGISCDMDSIMDIATRNKLYVIEDAAQGVNAKYKGKYLGSIGHMGAFSFHGTKNYTCGEGGALLMNTDDEALIEKAEIIRHKGTDREKFLRGEIDCYSWVGKGSSYSPSDVLMAMLMGQFEEMDKITEKRKLIHEYYTDVLKDKASKKNIKLINIPRECESNYHIFYLNFLNEFHRDFAMRELNSRGICATTHYVPLHSSQMGNRLGYKKHDLKVTEKVSQGLLRLPLYADMTKQEMEYVAENLIDIIGEL